MTEEKKLVFTFKGRKHTEGSLAKMRKPKPEGHGENVSKAQRGKKCPARGQHNKFNKGKTLEEMYGKERAKEIRQKQKESAKRRVKRAGSVYGKPLVPKDL